MNVTKAVILAAGEGSRMRPLTHTRPKVMLPIANRPILEHLLIEMSQAGIREFVFIVGYHGEIIRGYFGDGSAWGVRIQYVDQMKQMGTADALRMVRSSINENFIMSNGDIIIGRDVISRLVSRGTSAMSAVELPDVSGLGVLEVKDGKVNRIHEKSAAPPTHLANAGLYVFTSDIFPAVDRTQKSLRGEYELTDSIQIMIDNGVFVGYEQIDQWLDLSYPWDLLTANEIIMSSWQGKVEGEVEPNVTMKGMVSVGKGTVVRSGSYIVGPVVIGENCDIGPNCFIRPSTAIGNKCHVGAAVELKNTILMNGSKVPHLNYVGDSVIGENCNLGAGTKVANLKLNKKNVIINDRDTKRHKLGAIIGDDVQTGINASINVGTMIGNGSFVGPGSLAHGNIAPGSRIF